MAGGFAINGGEPLPQSNMVTASKVEEVRDLEWFKKQLELAGVSHMQIVWNAVEHFYAVESHLMDLYLLRRRTRMHREALFEAQKEYKAMQERKLFE